MDRRAALAALAAGVAGCGGGGGGGSAAPAPTLQAAAPPAPAATPAPTAAPTPAPTSAPAPSLTPAPPPPRPDQVGTLALWLDASQPLPKVGGGSASAVGDRLAAWPDGSGHSRVATASATKPTFSPVGMNGKPTINFNGNSKFTTAAFLDATFDAGFTLMVVGKASPGAANKVMVGTTGNGAYLAMNDATKVLGAVFAGLTPQPSVNPYVNAAGVAGVSYDGSTVMTEYDQLFNVRAGSAGNSSGSAPLFPTTGSLALSGGITIGDLAGGGFTWPGQISEVILWKGALTQNESRQMYDYLSAKWGFVSKVVVCGGNSLTSGTASSGGPTQILSPAGTNYPSKLWAALGPTYTVRTDAYPGRTLSQMLVETPKFGDMFCLPTAAAKNIYVAWEITNALAQGATRAATYNQLVTFCNARRAAGFKVVVVTCLPRQDGVYAGFEADRLAINAQVLAAWPTFADAVADVGSHASLQDPTNAAFYSGDKAHLVDAGYSFVASLVEPVVASL